MAGYPDNYYQGPYNGYPVQGQPMQSQPPMQGQPMQGQPMRQPVQGYQQPPYPMQQPAQRPQTQQGGYLCFPVTSREEAVANRVEAFGPTLIMPDLGHGTVYFKRFNEQTALADFEEFRRVQPQEETPPAPVLDYGAIVTAFAGRLDEIGGKIDSLAEKLDPKGARQTKGAGEK